MQRSFQTLLAMAREGNQDAQASLYTLFYNRLAIALQRFLGCSMEAEDLAQTAFTRMLNCLAQFDGTEEDQFFYWLTGLVREDVKRERQYSHRFVFSDKGLNERITAESAVQLTDKLMLEEALGSVTLDQRQVIRLYYFAGTTPQETATALNASVSTIGQRHRDGIEAMRRVLTA